MTAIRQEAIQMLEKVLEDKLRFVIQIMQGVNGLLGTSDAKGEEAICSLQMISSFNKKKNCHV